MPYIPLPTFPPGNPQALVREGIQSLGPALLRDEILLEAGSLIRSINYSAGTAGFLLNYDGSAFFSGSVSIAGDLLLDTGSTFKIEGQYGVLPQYISLTEGVFTLYTGTSATAAAFSVVFQREELATAAMDTAFDIVLGASGWPELTWWGTDAEFSSLAGNLGFHIPSGDAVVFGSEVAAYPTSTYTDYVTIDSSGLTVDSGTLSVSAGSAAAPTINFKNTTGLYWASDALRMAVAGTQYVALSSTRFYLDPGLDFVTLPTKNSTGHPSSPINGDMYVNLVDNGLYVYEGGSWRTVVTW